MDRIENEKKRVAQESLTYVKNGMVVGLGSGSTAEHMIRKLGKKIATGLTITGVASSEKTANLARDFGIPLTGLDQVTMLDINIDGADEFDPNLQLIKGGGGALLKEKILAHNSKLNIIIADSSKKVDKLGKFKLPIEVIPFAHGSIMAQLHAQALKPVLRSVNGITYRTDENNFIIDIDVLAYEDLGKLNTALLKTPGVVETGLFLESTDILIVGNGEETTTLNKR
ncbi:ribose-5-phosphate isomerase RpiA [Flavobacteriaceae bacterium 3-367]|uniref:ribose-5-phosphate isomerase RpiA n=1 Tax=Eudoraea algarum TaxID=3417568 RepID=UPI00328BA258